jgi:CHAD domain-containing protein
LFNFGVFFIQSKQLRIFLLMEQNKMNKEFLQKFKKLDDEISSLQDTEIKLSQQNSYLQDLQQQVSQAKQELEAIRELEFEIKN